MIRFVVRTAIIGLVAFGVAYYSNGTLLQVDSVTAGILFALVLGVLNGFLRPIVQFFALPLSIITLGIVALLINLGFFYLAAAIAPGVHTVGFWPTVAAALIVAIGTSIASLLVDGRESR